MKKRFDYQKKEEKIRRKWQASKIYQPDLDGAKKPYYVLYMFPYPSAEGLHVGHAFSGTGADVYARFMRMKGYDVFHPMGFDAFGIHSENYALKINDHPKNLIDRATKHFREQFDSLGFSYDWSHSVNTSSPEYYKWTQWLFIQLFKAGLAEKKKATVNWCPSCKTVLADEQVLSGVCERCGSIVVKKELEQWFFKITKYADRLLEGLNRIDWTEKVKLAQRNWIGRSKGTRIRFEVSKVPKGETIEVFTTRPDTLFGATFLVLSPAHPIVASLLKFKFKISNLKLDEIREYVERAKMRSKEDIDKEKTGIFSGFYAINPANREKIPVWIADYVVMEYGTGAIMGVPGHDERDFDFAKAYKLPIKQVIVAPNNESIKEKCYSGHGQIVNSGPWNGWNSKADFQKILSWLEKKKIGKTQVHYHLRDWLISRQRYWGAPIPMVYCSTCASEGKSWFTQQDSQPSGISNFKFQISNSAKQMTGWFPVPEEDLPVLLPYIENFKPLGTGVAPLAQDKKFVNVKCPNCGGRAKRETDVADTFLDSAWYFLRYLATETDKFPFPSKAFASENSENSENQTESDSLTIRNSDSAEFSESSGMAQRTKFLPVRMYIGGAEHSVLHLLYSRFITKVLFDLKFLDFDEPFTKFRAHGLLIKDGAKMSKSRGNIINPDEYIKRFGADTLRCYLMFLGPYEAGGDFRDSGIEGMERFLKRARKLVVSNLEWVRGQKNHSGSPSARFSANSKIQKSINRSIKGVGEDVENLRYNTALAKIMELVNDLSVSKNNIDLKYLKTLVILLAPFAPYLAEELWEALRASKIHTDKSADIRRSNQRESIAWSIHAQPWPKYDESLLMEDEVTIAVQVNGKLRGTITIGREQLTIDKAVEDKAREDPKISKYIEGKKIRKVIYVPGKILNFVV